MAHDFIQKADTHCRHLSENHSLGKSHTSERKPSRSSLHRLSPHWTKLSPNVDGKIAKNGKNGEITCQGKKNRSISPSGNQASEFYFLERRTFFRESGGGEFSFFIFSISTQIMSLCGVCGLYLNDGGSRLSLLRSFYGSTPYTQKFDRKCGAAFAGSML